MGSQREIEANRENWKKWPGVSDDGRKRQSAAAVRGRPWEDSTGPKTEGGKRVVRRNALSTGERCMTIEPFASANRLIKAIKKHAKSLREGNAIGEELQAACRRFAVECGSDPVFRICDAVDVGMRHDDVRVRLAAFRIVLAAEEALIQIVRKLQ